MGLRVGNERLDVRVHSDSSFASRAVAEEIIHLVKETAESGKAIPRAAQ